jgi:hypothetical protein
MEDNKEFTDYINEQKHLKPLSIRTYKNQYDKIRGDLKQDIVDTDEEDLLDYISDMIDDGKSVHSALNYLAMIINIKRFYKLSTIDLDKRREVMIIQKEKAKKEKNKDLIDAGLPSKKEILKHLDSKYKEENWRDFIILYLIINFHTRNKDLDVAFVDNITLSKNETVNTLVVKKTHVNYIRNNYKTSDSYGRKAYSIKNRKFREAVSNYLEQIGDTNDKYIYLLTDSKGNHVQEDSVQKIIARTTLNNLSTTLYNKILTTAAVKNGDMDELKIISERRGTTIPVLLQSYDLHVK